MVKIQRNFSQSGKLFLLSVLNELIECFFLAFCMFSSCLPICSYCCTVQISCYFCCFICYSYSTVWNKVINFMRSVLLLKEEEHALSGYQKLTSFLWKVTLDVTFLVISKNSVTFSVWNKMVVHRESTARREKGRGRHFFHQIEPNWPLPFSTVPVQRLRDARPMEEL